MQLKACQICPTFADITITFQDFDARWTKFYQEQVRCLDGLLKMKLQASEKPQKCVGNVHKLSKIDDHGETT